MVPHPVHPVLEVRLQAGAFGVAGLCASALAVLVLVVFASVLDPSIVAFFPIFGAPGVALLGIIAGTGLFIGAALAAIGVGLWRGRTWA